MENIALPSLHTEVLIKQTGGRKRGSKEHYIFCILDKILPEKCEVFICSVCGNYKSVIVVVIALKLVDLHVTGDKCTMIASCGYSHLQIEVLIPQYFAHIPANRKRSYFWNATWCFFISSSV